MDDRDLSEILFRLRALQQGYLNLRTAVAVHQAGKVIVAGFDLSLSTAQKKDIKAKLVTLATKMRSVADTLPVLTGAAGTSVKAIVDKVEAAPDEALAYLMDRSQEISAVVERVTPELQSDGTFRFIVPPESIQQFADVMATVRDTIKFAIGVERLKVK